MKQFQSHIGARSQARKSKVKKAEVAVIGWSCRLPGAASPDELWNLLSAGRCSVTNIPSDRWLLARFGHPGQPVRGRSYTWAAGVIDDIFGFDPNVFGISPREAEQMDPQQRLLLELTWEAFEDAGIPPSNAAGSNTGVYIGGSALDYGNLRSHDPAAGDQYFATGNTLSNFSNRISYILDLHGPSFTVDTACSASLVALDAAAAAIRSGKIDTAIVGGVSILASPFGFIGFSQAGMLSPTGLCRSFSAQADGYVRAEGAVVFVLRSLEQALSNGDPIHGVITDSGVNSDGRTNGISLPSLAYQRALLEKVYAAAEIDPNALAFIEAHGTGTRVGDPVEATALGEALGRRRNAPLPIGSIKTNIGHTEPVSGLAGVLKSFLALKHNELPPSLHCDEPNPDIPFADLNLAICTQTIPLQKSRDTRYAGISSFGFGGTNAHVIVSDAPARPQLKTTRTKPQFLLLSTRSQAALSALAYRYAERLEAAPEPEAAEVIASVAYHRDHLPERLVIPATSKASVVAALRNASEARNPTISEAARGTCIERDSPVAFVYSGNASQWTGMSREAYETNVDFRKWFDKIDGLFAKLSNWSLVEAIFSSDLSQKLVETRVAQPLIFANQVATTYCLASLGLKPAIVLGHSIGEVAAAEAAGILDLETAIRVIYFRSEHQERTRDAGDMMVLFGALEPVQELVELIPGLEIAAYNSTRCFTVSGSTAALSTLSTLSKKRKLRARRLDLHYPFHSHLMDPVETALRRDLQHIVPASSRIKFISTVDDKLISGPELDASYWWRNIREPVRFRQSIQQAIELGSRVFVEIGPSSTLVTHVDDAADQAGKSIEAFAVHHREPAQMDVFRSAVARVIAHGGAIDTKVAFGADPGPFYSLPTYPWQHKPFRLADTAESTGLFTARPWHPLIGARNSSDAVEWHSVLDTTVFPALADHRVAGQVLLPGAAFAEMALAIARDWHGDEAATVADLAILHPMAFPENASREILCRVTPSTSTLEIMSRPRLSKAPWVAHAEAKILKKQSVAPVHSAPTAASPVLIPSKELYAATRLFGLEFGPKFRQVAGAFRFNHNAIGVNLIAATPDGTYGLDPARLDSCFHGLLLLFSGLAPERPNATAKAYLPVRFGEIRLHKPGSVIAQALIGIKKQNEAVIVADFELFDSDGQLIAILTDARFQAAHLRPEAELSDFAFFQTSYLAAEPAMTGAQMHDFTAKRIKDVLLERLAAATEVELPQDVILLEGWATAVAYQLALALAENDRVHLPSIIASGRIPARHHIWLETLLLALVQSGLLQAGDPDTFLFAERISLPEPNDILQELAADYPSRSPELLLAAGTSAMLARLIAGEGDPLPAPDSSVDAFQTGSISVSTAADLIRECLDRIEAEKKNGRVLRILVIGYGPLFSALAKSARAHHVELCLWEPDSRQLEKAHLAFAKEPLLEFTADLNSFPKGRFDLVAAAQSLHRFIPAFVSLAQIAEKLSARGTIIAVEPVPSLFRDLVFGLREGWFKETGKHPAALLPAHGWEVAFSEAGFQNVSATTVPTKAGPVIAITAESVAGAAILPYPNQVLIIEDEGEESDALTHALQEACNVMGVACNVASHRDLNQIAIESNQAIVVSPGSYHRGDSVEELSRRCLVLKGIALQFAKQKPRLFILCPGAFQASQGKESICQTAFWSFTRTLANEFPELDVCRIDAAPELAAEVVAGHIARIVVSECSETDFIFDGVATKVLRFQALGIASSVDKRPAASAARLTKGTGSGLDRIRWTSVDREKPLPHEVEIAVVATGLNFRDVMWGLSILSDEMLEDGFAGPTLGLECAGHVVRIGEDVTHLKPGDHVVAFARGAFSTHVTVDAGLVAALPPHVPVEAAATIPVAFLTAYYGLINCAQLEPDEWVLIHGGAGGVGLAALQIAKWQGARVIATAGSAKKRELVKALGAEYVFDSRSSSFVDEVRRVTQERGVAVVLNSLSGEAMERSLGLLEPFGRFIELGKRDYLANTQLGLRPFRQNLTYFGVDLDQLLLVQPRRAYRLFADVMALFENGDFTALPYRSFDAHDFVDAMRLMQRSGHIGKILIKPPIEGEIKAKAAGDFVVARDKTHLITGGFGGFGLETALWLADHGARHLVLIGRSGPASDKAQTTLAELKQRGVEVVAASIDIADAISLASLFERIERTMPPLAGVVHAAMVLDDAIIANLDAERIESVLRPKVTGAENLDRLLGDRPLDYFVLFSSVTTVIGNPGQSAYVAANGFLEGLARARVSAGRKALAIAWGGIADVGVFARTQGLKETLAARAGMNAFDARFALDLMGQALARPTYTVEDAVIVITDMKWTVARKHLQLLNSPTYKALMKEEQASEVERREVINLAALAALPADQARQKLAAVIIEEIAHILRMPAQEVDRNRPLAEIGLDSLMAVELAMSIETRFDLETPLTTSAGMLNITELSDHILAMAEDPGNEERVAAKAFAQRHLSQDAVNTLLPFSDLLDERSQRLGRVL